MMSGDENNFLTSVSKHFDSLAVDSILKAPSQNKPQTQGQTRRNHNFNDMTAQNSIMEESVFSVQGPDESNMFTQPEDV